MTMLRDPSLLFPADEADRLKTLRQYDVRPSLREAVFDEFVGLTARLFNLPISLIALVEAEEVAYKANHGLPSLRSQPREATLCSVAISQRKAIVLANLADEEYQLPPAAVAAARASHLPFYAGVPLRMPDQHDIGTLCIIDHKPRVLSAAEQQLLENIAQLVALTIAVRHRCLMDKALGEDQWPTVQAQLVQEIQALVALVRYLATRFGTQVPISQAIIEPVQRRLHDVDLLLKEYAACE